jgi:hypothetical protein
MLIIEKAGRRRMFLTGLLIIVINNYAYFICDYYEYYNLLKYFILIFKFILGMVILLI